MKAPKVTVLMSVYNGELFIREAVESILGQTFADFEFLIIDDGSTDTTPEILASYQDRRIRLYTNPKNRGLISSLNKGLALAKGTYLARMDADDVSLPERLKKQITYMETHRDVGICGTWLSFFTRIPGVGGKYCPNGNSKHIEANLIFENVIQHPTVVVRTDVLRRNKLTYPTIFPHAEDYGLWVRLIGKAKFAIIPEILLHYRLHSDQIGQTKSSIQTASVAKIHEIILAKTGINYSKRDLSLHEQICFGRYDYTRDFINQVETWLLKIEMANRKSKTFDEMALRKVLATRWLSICLMHTQLRHWVWNRYRKSSLAGSYAGNMTRIRQLWLESTFFPAIRPYVLSVKKHPLVKKVLLG